MRHALAGLLLCCAHSVDVVAATRPALDAVRGCEGRASSLEIRSDDRGVARSLVLELDASPEVEHACAERAARLVIGQRVTDGCARVKCFGGDGNTRSDWPCTFVVAPCAP